MQRTFIFDDAPFPSCHASTVAETPVGLTAAWFGGTEEGADDVEIWFSRRPGGAWTFPVVVATGRDSEGDRQPTWNPVLHQAPDGPLLLFYKVGPSPREWWGEMKRSVDGGVTWSPAERLPAGILGPIRAKPLPLADGALLMGSSTEHDGWRVHFERTADLGRTWTSTGPIHDGTDFGAIQPTFLRHADGSIQALCRSRQNRIVSTSSHDQGLTWSPLSATVLPNPSAGIDAVTLPDGRHVLVYNHTSSLPDERPANGTRSALNLAVSLDGIAWSAALVLENQPGEYSYPAVILDANGLLQVTYTYRRNRIRHVTIDPRRLEPLPMPDGRWPGVQ